jgi:hypothetical protein
MPAIGQYAAQSSYAAVPDDIYEAEITSAEIVMDKTDPRIPETDKWGKNRIRIRFALDDQIGDDGGPVELSRLFAISYGATAGTYAALANLIQATTGIKCGDKAQRNVTTEQLVGKALRVQVANVEKDDKTFCNVVGTFAPKAKPAAARPAPVAAPKTAAAKLGLDDDDLDSIPF